MKKVGIFAIAIALMAPGALIAAAPAGAATLVTCAAPSGSVAFVPGLGATPKIQTTVFTLPIKGCKGGGVTSGSSKGSAKGTTKQTCVTFAAKGKTVTNVTITWNTKKTSTAKLTTTVSTSGTNGITATVTGKITKGLFVGKTLKTKVKVTIPKTAKCTDAAPLKKASLSGLAKVTIG
jgi:hypothetical protein